jgi:hypothetical protein
MSNEPIFERLAKEWGYDRMISDSPARPRFSRFMPVKPDAAWRGGRDIETGLPLLMHSGHWIKAPVVEGVEKLPPAEEISQELPQNVSIFEIINPEDAEEKYGTFANFVHQKAVEFSELYPDAQNVVVSSTVQIDGMVNVTISGIQPAPGTESFKKAHMKFVADLPEGDPHVVRAKKKVQEWIEPENNMHARVFKVPPQIIANQMEGHYGDSPLDRFTPEQTDESVNAAPADATPPQTLPKPLRILDEEDADEE